MKVLYINACVRTCSRTKELAEHLLNRLSGDITEIKLGSADIHSLNGKSLEARDSGEHKYMQRAVQFSEADIIVIAAPYWDMSFPALLKEYIENVCVSGITFRYENDRPVGMCKAKCLYYVTTAGGHFLPDFGYNYIEALAKYFYGIQKTRCFYAEGLDMFGADIKKIITEAKREIDNEAF